MLSMRTIGVALVAMTVTVVGPSPASANGPIPMQERAGTFSAAMARGDSATGKFASATVGSRPGTGTRSRRPDGANVDACAVLRANNSWASRLWQLPPISGRGLYLSPEVRIRPLTSNGADYLAQVTMQMGSVWRTYWYRISGDRVTARFHGRNGSRSYAKWERRLYRPTWAHFEMTWTVPSSSGILWQGCENRTMYPYG